MLTLEEQKEFLIVLEERFEHFSYRHEGIEWQTVRNKLLKNPKKLTSICQMEESGGEPDVVKYDQLNDVFLFFDCSKESPKNYRSCCYDQAALEARKKNKPQNSAEQLAEDMGIQLLTEEDYKYLQQLDKVDQKTSSWIYTPREIRKLGGALFGSRRYDRVFIYCNGADAYYSVRGFRGKVVV